MRLGLLGCGGVARWIHMPAIRALRGVRLVAAADPDPLARRQAEQGLRVPVCERPAELLGRADIDAVLICVPTHLHADLAVAAAQAGKHFYLEKPIATTRSAAERVIAAAARSGVVAAVGFNRRLHPLFQRARDLLAAGTLGQVRALHTVFGEPAPPTGMPAWKRRRETGGGVLLDLASHHADLTRWLLGEEITAVAATLSSAVSEHDGAAWTLTTASGAMVQSFFSFRAGPAESLEIVGERGTLRLDRHSAELSVRVARRWGYGTRSGLVPPSRALVAWRLQRRWRPAADPSYRRSLESFVTRVTRADDRGGASLEDGLHSLDVVLAAEAAAAAGRPVSPEVVRAAPGLPLPTRSEGQPAPTG